MRVGQGRTVQRIAGLERLEGYAVRRFEGLGKVIVFGGLSRVESRLLIQEV